MKTDPDEFLRTRRSVRRFTGSSVPADIVVRLIETAALAPSAHNRQPWRFAVLRQAEWKTVLSGAMADEFRRDLEADGLPSSEVSARVEKSRQRIDSAPIVVVICMDMSEMDHYQDPVRQQAERTMAIQSVSMAGLQLLLAAHVHGLGGVWNCGPLFVPTTVRRVLSLPDSWEPQGMLMLGYPAEQPATRARKPVEDIAIIR